MSKTALQNAFRVGLAMLLLMGTAAAAPAESQTGQAAAQPAADRSKIWGWWPLMPWDQQPVKTSRWADALNKPLDITRKAKRGDQHRYEIKRTNLTVDREGKVISRMVAEGRISRTLVREAEPGLWVEKCVWERYAAAQGMGPNAYPVPEDLLGEKKISFEFSPRTFDYINPPADFSGVGDDAFGYLLKVLTMDVMGWDAVLLSLRDEFKDNLQIGDISRQVDWEPWDITAIAGEGRIGQYRVGEMQVGIIGLTRFHGEPCVLIWISMEGNDVTQQMDTPQVALNMRSTEYFRGEMAASLLDGRLMAMELWGPLPCVMEMGLGGQAPREQPIGAIIQQVSIWEVAAEPKK